MSMRIMPRVLHGLAVLWIGLAWSAPAAGQSRESGPWWPNPLWGAGDQAGASNWITAEKIVESLSLVETGEVYELGYIYRPGMPLLNGRTYASVLMPGQATSPGALVFNEEFVAGELGQVGTQFDGLGHVGRHLELEDGTTASVFYNGVTLDDMRSRNGLRELGVEHMRPYLTRGILIDVAGRVGPLSNGHVVTLPEVLETLSEEGFEESDLRPGDALIMNLGWSHLWDSPERVAREWRERPVVDTEVLDWLVARQPSIIGWDTGANGTGHAVLTTENGIPSLEFLDLAELASDAVYEFLFVFTPLRLAGATGSPGRPIAIR